MFIAKIPIPQRVFSILNRLEPARQQALSNISKAQTCQKKNYDEKVTPCAYKMGDKVLLLRSHLLTSHSAKFSSKWDGPFYIHKPLENNAYKLSNLAGRVISKAIHGDRLKVYNERELEPLVVIEPHPLHREEQQDEQQH
jgi:hypothetical protein